MKCQTNPVSRKYSNFECECKSCWTGAHINHIHSIYDTQSVYLWGISLIWLTIEQSATSFAPLTSKPPAIAQQSQQQGTTATPSILSNVSCIQVTRDTGKKRAADSDVLQSMVYLQNSTSMRSHFDRIEHFLIWFSCFQLDYFWFLI